MALVRGAKNTLVNLDKKQHFYKALDLNMSIGSDTLREIVSQCLKNKGVSLAQHIAEPFVGDKINAYSSLCSEQLKNIRSGDPQLQKMDVSILSVLLLETFPKHTTDEMRTHVRQLRDVRNQLAHKSRAELENNAIFKQSSQIIISLAKCIGNGKDYALNLIKTINNLNKRELVNTYGNLDRVKINNEMYVVKLVESNGRDTRDNAIVIKIGLTKWWRHVARGIYAEEFLKRLQNDKVINDTLRRQILEEYSNEEQTQSLILHMVANETKVNLCKFCKQLRLMSPCLADLVENSDTDGRDTDKCILEFEQENIKRLTSENFEPKDDKKVATEEIHIFLEKKLGFVLDFERVKICVLEKFPTATYTDGDGSFDGLDWKTSKMETNTDSLKSETADEKALQRMSCEEFADYVAQRMSKVKETLFEYFQTAIVDESISPNAFTEMSKEEMKETFSKYVNKYGIGLEKELLAIQRKIKSEKSGGESVGQTMIRPFDSPAGSMQYSKGRVCCQTGNLLVPKHEFRGRSGKSSFTRYSIAKDVVQFTAACINGRKNGTIHFGISHVGNDIGEVTGIPDANNCWMNLNEEICKSVEICFGENASYALKCVRPFQRINIDCGGYVIEVDVVPFSKSICKNLISINFPPKGGQKKCCYMYNLRPDCELLPVVQAKVPAVEKTCEQLFHERQRLEQENDNSGNHREIIRKQLTKTLTGGNKYVTDEFVPVIVTGNISGCKEESNIRGNLDMDKVFASAKLVLDCDSSVSLRNKVERDNVLFSVKTAENFISNCDLAHTQQTWVYCNGNEELSMKEMGMEQWIDTRSDGVKNAFEQMKNLIPPNRAKVIFFVYQASQNSRDPLFEIARMAFVSSFRNQCIIVAENDSVIERLKRELTWSIGEKRLENCFFTGLNWREVSNTMKSVFRSNPDVICKLPHCDGYFVEMTKKEKEDMKLTDIEILSGEECIQDLEKEKLSDEDRRKHRNEAQEKFYRGGTVTWWNFYYENHVGKRYLFERHKREIEEKLSSNKGEALIEVHEIEHHPGAGGTTLGRHLVWYFSQFKGRPEKSYRCCVVKNMNVTEETTKQIEKFRSFKEGESPKPFIVFADNKSEDNIILLKTKLHEMAYKIGCPGKLFCLVLIVNRMSISHSKTDGIPVLTHKLDEKEKNWFEDKYKEMENSSDINVKTLIAFNLMRKSFDKDYLHKTIKLIMQDISKKERDVLKCLSVISSYESDHPVPENVFDIMMNETVDYEMIKGQPWGIAHSIPELIRLAKARNETWNIHMSDAMDLLITKREDIDFYNSGVCIISQMVAKEVTEYIKRKDGLSLEQLVDYVLDLVEKQTKETNPMSKRFVKIVCSLFKTRQLLESERGDLKLKFSDLVLELEHTAADETEEESQHRVLKVMKRCFEITEDAMVGQQLARFNIHIKSFDAAEEAIKMSLAKRQNCSYLLDTYGQIFKSKMESLLESCILKDNEVDDDSAAQIIELAFKAIEKFTEGQDAAISQEEDTNWGCFHTEVKTGLAILEKFEKFSSYNGRDSFLSFLNDDKYELNSSPYLSLMEKCPVLEQLRAGRVSQKHLETSLRSLEERNYQVKRQLYTIYSEDETLLLRLRERFERFYGCQQNTSRYQFTYGIGLKPLMTAKEKKKKSLKKRVLEAKENLLMSGLPNADERDLLVYIGDKIISLSTQTATSEKVQCSPEEYRRLLSYCNTLVSIQTSESSQSKRLYLETFLYFAMLHWPLKSRTVLDLETLAKPKLYEQMISQWEEAYNRNFYIKNNEQNRKNRPKNYFALGKGTPGNDIVDLESIRKEWMIRKKSTGRVRRPVIADNFWKESFVEERLERLEGTVDGSGHVVIHQAEYNHGTHVFKINTYYPCTGLSNRRVTFVLGFTWKGPTAFDVDEKGKLHQPQDNSLKGGLAPHHHDGPDDCDTTSSFEKDDQQDVKSSEDRLQSQACENMDNDSASNVRPPDDKTVGYQVENTGIPNKSSKKKKRKAKKK